MNEMVEPPTVLPDTPPVLAPMVPFSAASLKNTVSRFVPVALRYETGSLAVNAIVPERPERLNAPDPPVCEGSVASSFSVLATPCRTGGAPRIEKMTGTADAAVALLFSVEMNRLVSAPLTNRTLRVVVAEEKLANVTTAEAGVATPAITRAATATVLNVDIVIFSLLAEMDPFTGGRYLNRHF
ncbi:hypothetical protein GCM10007973_28570 [Polymorphobacter multimanifer]|nr:hypothetical protein GCM10007973_28570 [Polymorphobacter multimanifer]